MNTTPAPAAQPVNVNNVEKRKVAPLGQRRLVLQFSTNRLRRQCKNSNAKNP